MKQSRLKSLWWVIGLQYRTTKAAFFWNLLFNGYMGASGILTTYMTAKLITAVTSVAFSSGATRSVYVWLAGLLGLEIISSVLQSLNTLIRRRADQKLDLAASEQYYTKLYQLSQEQFEDETFNTVADRAREGLHQLWRVTYEITNILSSFVSFVAAMIAITVVAPVIGLVIIVSVIPVAIIRMRQNRSMDAAYKKGEPIDRVAWRTRWYLVDPQFMPEVRLINGFRQLVQTWRKNASKYNDMMYAVERRNALLETVGGLIGPVVTFFANVHFFRLLAAGSIGLDRFLFLRGIIDQAASSALSLATSFEKLHQVSIDFSNFNQFYYTEPAIPNGTVKVTKPLTIEFKKVSFTYPAARTPALKDVSFLIVPGSRLALVGENGAGKTTLIKLLLRQYLPSSGQILVNGVDIKDIERESYYAALSILSQDFLTLSHLTIKDNLTFGLAQEPGDTAINTALDMVGATAFVNKLPHKLEQRLDASFKDGSSLSGGQMQRLGVARSLLREGDVMILDEPTSAIDAKAEYNIFNNIYKAHADRTTLIVSHRFSTVRKADKVLVMEQGKIIEYGSHEELMQHGGLYKEMFDLQAEGYR